MNKPLSYYYFNTVLRGRGLGKMNIAFSLQKILQMGCLFFGVPRIYDRDCGFALVRRDLYIGFDKTAENYRVNLKNDIQNPFSFYFEMRC